MRFSPDRICSGTPALPPNVRTASPSRNTRTTSGRCAWLFACLCAILLSVTWLPAQAQTAGTVVAWGDNLGGQTDVPAGLTDVVAVAAGGAHTVALKADGTVVAWGYNDFGQTSGGADLSDVVAIAAGAYHTVALKADGTVRAWGLHNQGQTRMAVS
jgi:alpha-tubulin suppressor-like RCC1 family protein